MTAATVPGHPTASLIPDTGRPLVVYAFRGVAGGWAWSCRRCGKGYWLTSSHADALAAALWHCAMNDEGPTDGRMYAPESGE